MSSHLFHIDSMPPQRSGAFGSRSDVNRLDMPKLNGMALSLLSLNPNGMREPHWHPNADELGFCLEGKALMTIFSPGAKHDTFVIEPGSLCFVPMGSLHHVENIGPGQFKMLLCYDNDEPEDLDLSSSIGAMPDTILGATFKVDPGFFSGLKAEVKPVFMSENAKHLPQSIAWQTNQYKMALEGTLPQVNTRGGWVKMSNSFLMPTLSGLSMYSVQLEPKGAREPHWHPNANELNYLISGTARITLLSPGGNVDTFDMKAGDMSFLPKGYLHHIENTGKEPARFAIFFNHTNPSDIGLSGCLGAYPNEVLASLFKVPVSYFDKLPKYQSDLFVVSGGG